MTSSAANNNYEAGKTRFRQEWARFEALRPQLMADDALRGRWVVYFDGQVQHAGDSLNDCYEWAVEHLGVHAGFVVDQVAEPKPIRVYTSLSSTDP